MDIRVVNDGQNQAGGVTAAHVRGLTRANALIVAQVNISGDIVNPGGGGAGGDGAINDGADSSIKATVLTTSTARPVSTDNPLLVQFADDATRDIGRLGSTVGVQIVGGSGGGTFGVSGDVAVKQSGSWSIAGSGDMAIVDGVTRGTKATVYSAGSLRISGDVLTRDADRPSTGNYGRINVTTTATLVRDSNLSRAAILIQNVETQQVIIGFDSSVTVATGLFLSPILSSSGDGGFWTSNKYRGAVYAIMASGDADVRWEEI